MSRLFHLLLPVLILGLAGSCSERQNPRQPATPEPSGAAQIAPAISALQNPDETAFTAEYLAWLLALEPSALAGQRNRLLEAVAKLPVSPSRLEKALEWFDKHLADVAPARAGDTGDTKPVMSGEAGEKALLAMAGTSPLEALDLFLTSTASPDRDFTRAFAGILSEKQPAAVLARNRLLMRANGLGQDLAVAIYARWVKREPEAAWKELVEKESPPMWQATMPALLEHALQSDIGLAARWLKQVPNPLRKQQLGELFRTRAYAEARKKPLELARVLDTREVWLAWAEIPRFVSGGEWISEVLKEVPEAHREVCLLAALGQFSSPESEQMVAAAVADVKDPKLRDLAAAVLQTSPEAALKPRNPHGIDDTMIDEALQEGYYAMDRLCRIQGGSRSQLLQDAVRRHGDKAIEWVTRNVPPGEESSVLETLGERFLPRARIGPWCLELLAKPDASARRLGVALAHRWLGWGLENDLESLTKLPADQARMVFSGEFTISMGSNPQSRRALIEAMEDPIARKSALAKFDKNIASLVDPMENLARLKTLPPGAERTRLLKSIGYRTSLIDKFAAELNQPESIPIRDEILAMAAESFTRRDRDATSTVSLLLEIRDHRIFLEALQKFGWVSAEAFHGWKVFERLGNLPSGHLREQVLFSQALNFTRQHPGEVLPIVRANSSPAVKRALIKEHFSAGIRAPVSGDFLAEAEKLPIVWQPPEIAKWRKEWRLLQDPVETWESLSKGNFHGGKSVIEARQFYEVWERKDPVAARRALLELRPPSGLGREFLRAMGDEVQPALRFETLRAMSFPQPDILYAVIYEWVGKDPAAAMAATLMIPGPDRGVPKGPFVEWFQDNPPAAMAWVEKLPPGPTQTSALKAMFTSLAKERQADAREFFSRLMIRMPNLTTDPEFEEVRRLAAAQTEVRPPPLEQTRTSMASLAKLDPAQSMQALQSMPEGACKCDARLGLIDHALASENPGLRKQMIEELTRFGTPLHQYEAAMVIAGRVPAGNHQAALEALSAIPWPDARGEAACRYLSRTRPITLDHFQAIVNRLEDPTARFKLALAAGFASLDNNPVEPAVLDSLPAMARDLLIHQELATSLLAGGFDKSLAAAMELPVEEARPIVESLLPRLRAGDVERAMAAIPREEKRNLLRAWLEEKEEKP